jgi:hypothetical protein
MGRWSQYDEVRTFHYLASSRHDYQNLQDDYRLPEGFERVGYDADSGKYFFRDREGQLWEGQEGERFGEMTRGTPAFSTLCFVMDSNIRVAVSVTTVATQGDGNDVENGPQGEDGYALTGDDVSVFTPYHASGSRNPIYGAAGQRSPPTVFERQPLPSALPILSDHHRRVATGLAAGRLAWFDTGQIRKMPRGKFTCGRRGWRHVLEDC